MVVEPLLAGGVGLGEDGLCLGAIWRRRPQSGTPEPPEVPEAGLGKVIEDYSLAQVASSTYLFRFQKSKV